MLPQLHSQTPANLGLCSGEGCPSFGKLRSKKNKNTQRGPVSSTGTIAGSSAGVLCQDKGALPRVLPVLPIFVCHQTCSLLQLKPLLSFPLVSFCRLTHLMPCFFQAEWQVLTLCSYQVATKVSGDPNYCTSRNKW